MPVADFFQAFFELPESEDNERMRKSDIVFDCLF